MNTELSHFFFCGTVCVIVLVLDYTSWFSSMHQASCLFTCNRTRPKIVKCACELGIPNHSSVELEPNPNRKTGRTEPNPNLHCSVRFPSLLQTEVAEGLDMGIADDQQHDTSVDEPIVQQQSTARRKQCRPESSPSIDLGDGEEDYHRTLPSRE